MPGTTTTTSPGNSRADARDNQTPPWMDLANCADVDADVMFPDPGADASAALEVCAGCGVREECLAHALANGERYGVWGGRTADQRVNLLGFRRPARRRHARRTTPTHLVTAG